MLFYKEKYEGNSRLLKQKRIRNPDPEEIAEKEKQL